MLTTALICVLAVWVAVAGYFFLPLTRLWREPVLRRPVVILESDDWGPGPEQHAESLRRLADLLVRFRDSRGRHPTMTLAVALAVPDTEHMHAHGTSGYARVSLSAPRFSAIVDAMRAGVMQGVYALQLHGMEHFWPPALMAAAASDAGIGWWLTQQGVPMTEDLPSHLQSRWVDASVLPSRPLSGEEIRDAAREEVRLFTEVFGNVPEVVVPPTFVWDDRVEHAWAAHGARIVVTPGRRYESRDAAGRPSGAKGRILNGERGRGGMRYLVRDIYFEPALGHTADRSASQIAAKAALRRPSLVEVHRLNFVRGPSDTGKSLTELEKLLQLVLARLPHARFMSTAELAHAIASGDSDLVEHHLCERIKVWLLRSEEIPRLRKLARLSGLAAVLWLISLAVRDRSGASDAEGTFGAARRLARDARDRQRQE